MKSVKDLLTGFKGCNPNPSQVDCVIFPPAVHISTAMQASAGSPIEIGVQNPSKTKEGAFTGEVTCGMVKDLGMKWVMVGHSERRSLYGETDADCAEKIKLALASGLMVMFCIGETLKERKGGITLDVCAKQISAVLPAIGDWSRIVIAYEPVWAIGTGVVATPMQAQETHYQIRNYLKEQCGGAVSDAVRILYGGSVSPGNCQALGELPDVDGFLVGGAAMKPDFTKVILSAQDLYAGK